MEIFSLVVTATIVMVIGLFFRQHVIVIVQKLLDFITALVLLFYTWHYNRIMFSKKKDLFRSLGEHLASVQGDIVEIGAGTGANFQFYPDGCSVIAVEPNSQAERFFKRSKNFYPKITLKKYIVGAAEDLREIEDGSVAAVVITLVLCSVQDGEKVMKEVKRILKPGGRYYFLEHVAGTGWKLKSQKFHDIFWPYIDGGCHMARRTEDLLRKAAFKNLQCLRFEADIWYPPVQPHIMGYAEV